MKDIRIKTEVDVLETLDEIREYVQREKEGKDKDTLTAEERTILITTLGTIAEYFKVTCAFHSKSKHGRKIVTRLLGAYRETLNALREAILADVVED